MTSRLTLGYPTVIAHSASLVADAGTVLVGDEFHRTVVEPRFGAHPAWQLEDGTMEGFTTGGDVVASYIHLHPAGVPSLALNLVRNAALVAA